MKVLHFIPSIDKRSGGTGTYIQTLCKKLGVNVELHIITFRTKSPLELENCELYLLENKWFNYFKLKKEWEFYLKKINPDLVHINCCWQPEIAFIQFWSQHQGYKIILTPHGMLEPWILKRNYFIKKLPALLIYQKKAIKSANIIHATSKTERLNLLQLNLNDKIKTIPIGLELNKINLKTNFSKNNKIIFFSRIHKKKGIEILLESISSIKKLLINYQVIIAGNGQQKYIDLLNLKTKEYNIEDIVKFIGPVYGENKWKLFEEADIFVLPTFSESFGIVIAEALASGTPVITTTETPWKEIEERNCGWIIEPRTEQLVEKIKLAIQLQEEDLKIMGNNGRKLIEEKYNIEKTKDEFIQLYNNLINNNISQYDIK